MTSSNYKFFTDFTGIMVFLIIGSCVAGIVEGINIGRNVKTFYMYYPNEIMLVGEHSYFNFEIREAARINMRFDSEYRYDVNTTDPYDENRTYIVTHFDPVPIILSVMSRIQFEDWAIASYPEPTALNSTFYYHRADFDVNNLQVSSEDDYYFIVFNDSEFNVTLDLDVTIIPWGHITAASIMAFILLFGLTGFFAKIIATAYFNSKNTKPKRDERADSSEQREEDNDDLSEDIDGKFCQSCGSPLTPKDTRYCPQCGASV